MRKSVTTAADKSQKALEPDVVADPIAGLTAAVDRLTLAIEAALRGLPGWPAAMGFGLVVQYVGLSKSTVSNLRRAGEFPRAVVITPGRIVWLRDDLDDWLARKAGRKREYTGDALEDWPDG